MEVHETDNFTKCMLIYVNLILGFVYIHYAHYKNI